MTDKDIIKESYTGIHRGIHFEICKHMLDAEGGPWWNTYIILNSSYNKNYIEYLWVEEIKSFIRYNGLLYTYHDPNDLWSLLSWNGGSTFYEQIHKPDWEFKSIKIGDDYQHSWDYEKGRKHLCLDYMIWRCKIMIDQLIERMDRRGIKEFQNDR